MGCLPKSLCRAETANATSYERYHFDLIDQHERCVCQLELREGRVTGRCFSPLSNIGNSSKFRINYGLALRVQGLKSILWVEWTSCLLNLASDRWRWPFTFSPVQDFERPDFGGKIIAIDARPVITRGSVQFFQRRSGILCYSSVSTHIYLIASSWSLLETELWASVFVMIPQICKPSEGYALDSETHSITSCFDSFFFFKTPLSLGIDYTVPSQLSVLVLYA